MQTASLGSCKMSSVPENMRKKAKRSALWGVSRRLHFVGHAARCIKDRYQPVADLEFWQGSGPMRRGQGNRRTFLKTIISDLGVHMTAAEISRCAADRDEWRKRMN